MKKINNIHVISMPVRVSGTFNAELVKAVTAIQAEGEEVETQFCATDNRFSALVIGRKEAKK